MLVDVGWEGRRRTARLFMDPGSQRSYIRKTLAESLELPIVSTEANRHSLFGGKQTEVFYHKTHHAKLYSLDGRCNATVYLKGHDVICGAIPRLQERHPVVQELTSKGIYLTDVGQGEPTIDILIGSDYYLRLLGDRKVPVGFGLTALETCLGWVVAGETRKRDLENTIATTLLTMHQTESDLGKLFDLEAIGIQDPAAAIETAANEKQIVQRFQADIQRKPSGRYVVKLPWKQGHPPLPENRVVAIKRLESTTRKLKKTDMFAAYNQIFLDWEKEGFIEKVNYCLRNHYIPHRPVFKNYPTTPVRPVFDASCKVGDNVSLNDCLETGANFTKLILEHLLRFREKEYGVISDIRKAFQMIEVTEEGRNACSFLWWNENKELMEYRHSRVMFGATCSPFILGAVLDYHLKNVKEADKSTAIKLLESMYVDNCVTSVDTLQEYFQFQQDATRIMADAQMELRLWMSNGDYLEDDEVVPVLGLQWDRNYDTLFVDVKDI